MSRQLAERRGRKGETIAAWWLRLHGWRILAIRARTPVGEVDLIARRFRTVAFIEVKSRATAAELGLGHVEFRSGLAEELPVDDGWADAVISNGVVNLCADKRAVFAEIFRILRPGGVLQFADIANGRPIPAAALRDIDLWTGCIAGGLPRAGWHKMLENSGFTDVVTGPAVDTFGGSHGEGNARAFAVYGYAFMASKPGA